VSLGCHVAIFGRNAERLASAKGELESVAKGSRWLTCQGDVREPKDLENAAKATVQEFGKIDILINGAAGNFLAPFS